MNMYFLESEGESVPKPSTDQEKRSNWLENIHNPFSEAFHHWDITYDLRFALLKTCTISQYYQLYPSLYDNQGHKLVS